MELVVNVVKLKEEVENAKAKYLKSQSTARILYVDKIQAYADYIKKRVKEGKPITKYAPSLHYDALDVFNKALEGLSLHTEETIRISSDELSHLKQGINNAVAGSANYVEELTSISYEA